MQRHMKAVLYLTVRPQMLAEPSVWCRFLEESPLCCLQGEQVALPLRLPPEHLFTCTVGRQQSKARYTLSGSAEVSALLEQLTVTIPFDGEESDSYIDDMSSNDDILQSL